MGKGMSVDEDILREFHLLCDKHIDGTINDEESARFSELLKSSDELVQILVETSWVHLNAFQAIDELMGVESNIKEVDEESIKSIDVKKPFYINAWGGIAASILLIVGLWFLQRSEPVSSIPSTVFIGQVISADGGVIRRGGKSILADIDTSIQRGDEVLGALTFQYIEEQTVVSSGKKALFRVLGDRRAKDLYLDRGRLSAIVETQIDNEIFSIQSPHAVAKVVGTTLSVNVEETYTRLDVEVGAVRFERRKDNKAINVAGGYFAVTNDDDFLPKSKTQESQNEGKNADQGFDRADRVDPSSAVIGDDVAWELEALIGRKVYHCEFSKSLPQGALGWNSLARVRKGHNRENRFVNYNSAAAKSPLSDAMAERLKNLPNKSKGRETSFFMGYDTRGWHVYVESLDPNIEEIVAAQVGRESIELFFVPGLNNVYYHQMIIDQLSRKTNFYDWLMPHRGYRSLQGLAKVDVQVIDGGFGTHLFVPWEVVYDRLPISDTYWRFSLMRPSTGVTWGGSVHDTGNFGFIHFVEPSPEGLFLIQQHVLKTSWYKFQRSAAKASKVWADPKTGDVLFYESTLKPVIDSHMAVVSALGKPDQWDGSSLSMGQAYISDWMEFDYKVAELRAQYLSDKHFKK